MLQWHLRSAALIFLTDESELLNYISERTSVRRNES